ncbi:DUF4859 domain-containing protein, partial [Saccharicrinis sp. FJH62]|uniref:DUF4859 domain-containing protein n=1 Tax=Saccharicrinis sp. FJH62 TaxID=3344657 RepID=UPI0035D4EB3B
MRKFTILSLILLMSTFMICAKAQVTGTIVDTQNFSVEVIPNTSYAIDTVEFDLSKILTDLGITSISEATVIGFNEDGSYTDSYTADDGYWTARNGYVSTWGGGGVAFTAYGVLSDNQIGVGQFPDSLHVGETAKTFIGFLANEKIEKIVINISVVAAPEITAT